MNGKPTVVNNNNNKKKPFIVVVAGPSGTGKTTIGNFLSSELNSLSSSQYNIGCSTFIEGDDFHSKEVCSFLVFFFFLNEVFLSLYLIHYYQK